MKINDLVNLWDATASGALTSSHYSVRLPIEDAAKLAALAEMYPKRTSEQLITDLLSAALIELESGMPYIKGSRIISEDEMGDPVYEDRGLTPKFIELTHKHMERLKQAGTET
jgi:hypothetical protein